MYVVTKSETLKVVAPVHKAQGRTHPPTRRLASWQCAEVIGQDKWWGCGNVARRGAKGSLASGCSVGFGLPLVLPPPPPLLLALLALLATSCTLPTTTLACLILGVWA